jgi:hypothetical protein
MHSFFTPCVKKKKVGTPLGDIANAQRKVAKKSKLHMNVIS